MNMLAFRVVVPAFGTPIIKPLFDMASLDSSARGPLQNSPLAVSDEMPVRS
jgi:hypothetical protein